MFRGKFSEKAEKGRRRTAAIRTTNRTNFDAFEVLQKVNEVIHRIPCLHGVPNSLQDLPQGAKSLR